MQWDDEFTNAFRRSIGSDDEWSKLFQYYAKTFENTGEILASSRKEVREPKEPHTVDMHGKTPLHYAALLEDPDCLRILLRRGAAVDEITKEGYTALHFAVKNPENVRELLEYKANPNKCSFVLMDTALHMAAAVGNCSVVSEKHVSNDKSTELNAHQFSVTSF